MKTTPIKAVSTAAATMTIQTTTFAGTATHNLSIAHLRILRDYFRATQLVSGFENGKYVGILSTHAARGIKNDDEYKAWLAPTTSGPLMDGRMRDVEGFALFETNNNDACTDQIASGKTGEAIFMAADPAFLAVVQDPELRAGLKTNLGRFQDLGWVGTLEAGLTWPEFADARVIHWGTA
jgi:hypothetical protein